MERTTGIRGVFFRARDPDAPRRWHAEHLGIDVQAYGGASFEGKVEESEFGRFGWATDPEGNRFELWQPPAA